ncbi:MAG: signal peptide peptidase SppA [Propioniciclava sp.]
MERMPRWTQRLFGQLETSSLILEIDLDRGILSAVPDNPLAAYRAINSPSMRALRDGLHEAADDARVRGLVVNVGTSPLSATQTDELGDLIEEFRQAKPTVAYAAGFGEFTNGVWPYRLATRTDEIWMQPSGMLTLAGVHLNITLLRGGLEKLGIEPEFAQRKEYKSAGEQFAGHEVSTANREMITRLGTSLMEEAVQLISDRRSLAADAVWEAINTSPLTAEQAQEQGFVDRIGYRDQVYADLRERWEVPKRPDGSGLRFVHRYGPHGVVRTLAQLTERAKPAVGMITLRGSIVSGRGQSASVGSQQSGSGVVCDHLRAAADDDAIKAVIFRVDSPGGSALASDEIRREVQQLTAIKPVVASMGDVAASGGYYVSMAATEIVANPSTLTGSIGVVAGKFVTQGFYDKLGLIRESIDVGARAGMLTGAAAFSADEWDVLNTMLDDIYLDFTTKAAEDRGMRLDDLEPLARGRVWTGADAAERGLVDHIGGMSTALARACTLADLDRTQVQLRAIPIVPLLARLRPAESSESTNAATQIPPTGLESLATAVGTLTGPHLLRALLTHLGAPGVLSLPWQIRIS